MSTTATWARRARTDFVPQSTSAGRPSKRQMAQIDAEFLLHGGDLTRDGETHEFEYAQARDDLDTLPFPVFVIPGNMDVGNKHAARSGAKRKWEELGLGWNDPDLNMTEHRLHLFASYFGPIHWTFLHRGVRFTGFRACRMKTGCGGCRAPARPAACPPSRGCDALLAIHGGVGRTRLGPHERGPIRQLVFLHRPAPSPATLAAASSRRRRHPVPRPRAHRAPRSGCRRHPHMCTQPAGNTAQLAERWPEADTRFGFHCCEVTDAGIEITFIPGDDQCAEFDSYGPMGHPPVGVRDYSAARESPALIPDAHD